MGLAAVLGFLIGLERESRGKSAGERTFAIVAAGAAGFAGTAITIVPRRPPGRPSRASATGIGFLGVGIIWRAEEGETRGLTTAASILVRAPRSASYGHRPVPHRDPRDARWPLFILRVRSMPGLRGCIGRVTGRPDMEGDGQTEPQLAGAVEHGVEHRRRELAGERVLLAGVEAADQRRTARRAPRRGGRTAGAASPRARAGEAARSAPSHANAPSATITRRSREPRSRAPGTGGSGHAPPAWACWQAARSGSPRAM